MNIQRIIDALNVGGRQGPQSLLSDECYSWVTASLDISRPEYTRLIEENTIDADCRALDRTALFVRSSTGRVTLFKSSEDELRPYVCLATGSMSPPVTSSRLIDMVKALYPHFTPVDLMNQNNLSSPQMRIDQTIRNILVSNYLRPANRRLFDRQTEDGSYVYSLTEDGRELTAAALEELVRLRENPQPDDAPSASPRSSQTPYSQDELEGMHRRPVKYSSQDESGRSPRPVTDSRLLETVIFQNDCKCAVDPGHVTFESQSGMPNFVEGHHLIPLSAQRRFPDVNLDCPENLVALCPNCHSALHYGTAGVRRAYLDRLLHDRRPLLNAIGISDDTIDAMMWRFYLCEYR